MVRNRHDGSGSRDLFKVRRGYVELNLKIIEETACETLLATRTRIQLFKQIDFEEMIDRIGQRHWQSVGGKSFECHSSAYWPIAYSAMNAQFRIGVGV